MFVLWMPIYYLLPSPFIIFVNAIYIVSYVIILYIFIWYGLEYYLTDNAKNTMKSKLKMIFLVI